jgi:hypothetical protein
VDPSIQISLITGIAALLGAMVGGLSTFATTVLTQRYVSRRELFARDLTIREALYGRFLKEASVLFIDSLDKTLDKPAALVELFALMAQIRLLSTARVLDAAENVGREILASYSRPAIDFHELVARKDHFDPLHDFTQACREEREMATGRIRASAMT